MKLHRAFSLSSQRRATWVPSRRRLCTSWLGNTFFGSDSCNLCLLSLQKLRPSKTPLLPTTVGNIINVDSLIPKAKEPFHPDLLTNCNFVSVKDQSSRAERWQWRLGTLAGLEASWQLALWCLSLRFCSCCFVYGREYQFSTLLAGMTVGSFPLWVDHAANRAGLDTALITMV